MNRPHPCFHREPAPGAPLWFVTLLCGLVVWATWAILRTSERHAQIPPEIRALVKKG